MQRVFSRKVLQSGCGLGAPQPLGLLWGGSGSLITRAGAPARGLPVLLELGRHPEALVSAENAFQRSKRLYRDLCRWGEVGLPWSSFWSGSCGFGRLQLAAWWR